MYVGGCQQLAELDTGSVGKKFCRGKYDELVHVRQQSWWESAVLVR